MKKTAQIILPVFFGVASLISTPLPVLAQELTSNSTITAIPPRVDLKANPGESVTTELKIRNETNQLEYFTVYVNDFIVSDNMGTPIPVSENVTNRWSMSKWITAPQVIPVDKQTLQTVKVTIRVPKDALPGGHYAMVTYQPRADQNPADLQKTGAMIGQRVGSLILLTVNGDVTQNAQLIDFSTAKFHEYGPVNFDVSVQNESDIHVQPKGSITITDFLGNKVTEIKTEFPNIFPEATRSLVSNWPKKWGYGRYKATLDLSYGTAGGVISSTLFFWLFPIRLVMYSLLAIISTLIAIILFMRRRQDHEKALEAEVAELKEELADKYKDSK